jgi:hypothetical protein
MENQRQDDKCHLKARERGQRTFTLVEQDLTAPRTIAYWILENIETCPRQKLHLAIDDACDMRAAKFRKLAD